MFEVKDASGRHVGLWYFDPYARTGKKSGAWMNEYRTQERFDGEIPTIVSNNANFVKPQPGEPVLVSWEDAVTLFHEFGHALHGLCSNVSYPSLSGTNVARDYVEFPSQLLEHWLETPEVLNRYARPLQDRPADPARAGRQDPARIQVQPRLRDGRVPRGRTRRHEAAPRRWTGDRRWRRSNAKRSPNSACRRRS